MGIINFFAAFLRPSAASVLLAPAHVSIAFFVPAQTASASLRDAASLPIKQRALTPATVRPFQNILPARALRRLKVVRQLEPGVSRSCTGRLVISGCISDVCAELEHLALLETANRQI